MPRAAGKGNLQAWAPIAAENLCLSGNSGMLAGPQARPPRFRRQSIIHPSRTLKSPALRLILSGLLGTIAPPALLAQGIGDLGSRSTARNAGLPVGSADRVLSSYSLEAAEEKGGGIPLSGK